eukprot:1173658-Pyramimonas_sp.AAC.1
MTLPQCQRAALAHLMERVRELGPKPPSVTRPGALQELRVFKHDYAGDLGQGTRPPMVLEKLSLPDVERSPVNLESAL